MRLITWRTAPALAVLLLFALFVAFAQITTPLEMRPELRYDGVQYLRMVEAFRTGAATRPETPFTYRVLPAGLVAASGLDPTIGFFALDVAALLGTGLLIVGLMRRHVAPAGALAVVAIWGLLPYGPRFAIHYPVLTDFLGAFLFAALLMAAHASRYVVFALLLVAAVLTRENLILCAPLLLLRTAGNGPRAVVASMAAAAPAVAALLAVHVWPPVAPPSLGATTFEYVGFRAHEFITNHDGGTWRVLAAPFFGLGAVVGLLVSRRALAVTRSEPGWPYLITGAAVLSALGGGDPDRYLSTIAPLILLIAVRALPPQARTRALIALIPLQLIAARIAMPLGGDELTHAQFSVGLVSLDTLAAWAALIAGCGAVAAVIGVAARDRMRAYGGQGHVDLTPTTT